jgi:acyl-CoA synthetase (AMP-forming)/AMP-acid ligase II
MRASPNTTLPSQSISVFSDIIGRESGGRSIVLGETRRSYSELCAAAESIAKRLRALGLSRGARVGICLDQGFEYIAGLLGVWQAGGISVLMSPGWTMHERERVLKHSGASFMLAEALQITQTSPIYSASLGELNCVLTQYAEPEDSGKAETGDAVIIYTSGSTGSPKGVVLTEAGISANVSAVCEYLSLENKDSAAIFTPSCYAYSLSQNLAQAWSGGSMVPFPSGLRFPLDILQSASLHRITGISATPTAFRMLCDTGMGTNLDLDSVRFIMCGGQPLHNSLVERIRSLFRKAKIINMYGCTENSPRISYHYVSGTAGMDERGYCSVGRPVRGTQIQIATDDKQPAGSGQVGEILISGTSMMRAYWQEGCETDNRVRNGWFHTRDLGYLDGHGLLHLTGRESTIINVGNEKVSPEEVEKILLEFSGVSDVAVFGMPDSLLGEAVAAQVAIEKGSGIRSEDIQRYCRTKLSSYKIPKEIVFVDKIPRTLYGKVDRNRLRPDIYGNTKTDD